MTIYDQSPLSTLLHEIAALDKENQAQLKATTVALSHLSADLNKPQPLTPLLTDLQSIKREVAMLPHTVICNTKANAFCQRNLCLDPSSMF